MTDENPFHTGKVEPFRLPADTYPQLTEGTFLITILTRQGDHIDQVRAWLPVEDLSDLEVAASAVGRAATDAARQLLARPEEGR